MFSGTRHDRVYLCQKANKVAALVWCFCLHHRQKYSRNMVDGVEPRADAIRGHRYRPRTPSTLDIYRRTPHKQRVRVRGSPEDRRPFELRRSAAASRRSPTARRTPDHSSTTSGTYLSSTLGFTGKNCHEHLAGDNNTSQTHGMSNNIP